MNPFIIHTTVDQTADNVIGLAQNGFLALKHHSFFTGIPWGELVDMEAPCKPSYDGDDDSELSRAFNDIGKCNFIVMCDDL